MPDDEIGAGAGRAPGHSEVAVDKNLPSFPQGGVNEVDDVVHVLSDICLVNINELQTFIFYSDRFVIILINYFLKSK